MPSGWENEPDYGGPEPTWWGLAVIVLVICALAALLVFAVSRQPSKNVASLEKPGHDWYGYADRHAQ